MKIIIFSKNKDGQTLIELLIGVVIISMVFIAIATMATRSVQLSQVSQYRHRAIFLAKERVEEIRAIRNGDSWSGFYASLGAIAGLPVSIEDTGKKIIFTRTTTLSNVSTPSTDENKVLVEVMVEWNDFKGSHEIIEQTFLTDWQ